MSHYKCQRDTIALESCPKLWSEIGRRVEYYDQGTKYMEYSTVTDNGSTGLEASTHLTAARPLTVLVV